jgi:PII-like signaling protein
MDTFNNAKLLRIFIGETDKIGNINLYEKIVISARKENLAGATVYRGIMGFGKNSIIHTSKIFALSDDMPLVIEIVDDEEKINNFIPTIKDIFKRANNGGLITVEKAEIIYYSSSK